MMKNIFVAILLSTLSVSCFKKEIDLKSLEENRKNTVDSSSAIIPTNEETADLANVSDSLIVDNEISSQKISYSEAEQLNTSEGWKRFLKENPDYQNKEEINEKLIRAEVNEITNDKNTGEMPASEKIRGGNQALSSVNVENNTSCDLTLRYSGTDAKMIVIPPNSTQKVQVKSGQYKVVATACGYNYAGSEALTGDYEVVYYIQTVRY